MRMKDGLSLGTKSSVAVKVAQDEIKVPKSPIKYVESENEKDYKNDSDLEAEENELTKQLENLNLNFSEKKDDNDDVNPDEIVAKGPTRKIVLRENTKTLTSPYPVQQTSINTLSGGTVTTDNLSDYVPNFESDLYLPESVAELSGNSDLLPVDEGIDFLLREATEKELSTLYSALPSDQLNNVNDLTTDSTFLNNFSSDPIFIDNSTNSTFINSPPTTSFINNFPSSSSPETTFINNFSSTSTFKNNSSNSIFVDNSAMNNFIMCPPSDTTFINTFSPPSTLINSSPNHSFISTSPTNSITLLSSDSADYTNITSPHDSGISMSPLSMQSLHSPNPSMSNPKCDGNQLESINQEGCTFQQQKVMTWVGSIPQSYSPISQENSLTLTIPQSQVKNTILNARGNTWSLNPELPFQSIEIKRPTQQIISTQHVNIQNVQIGEPTTSITITPQVETKTYAPLLPMRGIDRRRPLDIKPGGLEVSEVNLDKPGTERLCSICAKDDIKIAWTKICMEKENDITSLNDEKQTKLMQALRGTPGKQFLEGIYSRVQLIKKSKRFKLLSQRDVYGQTALSLATTLHKKYPVLSRFIADAYVELNMNPDEIYGTEKNSLLHIIAEKGDDYAQVLADLLHVKQNGTRAFDVNKRNKKKMTPLIVAASNHLVNNVSTLAITQQLVKNDALITLQNEEGKTPLHLAIEGSCDPVYIKALLQSLRATTCVNIQDKQGNTPLHLCAEKQNISLEKQKEVIHQLITSGASHNIHNKGGRLASSLVPLERKQEIKKLLNRK